MKTREQVSDSCSGVDLLSNFDHGDFTAGSNEPCSDKYRGPYPMSAVETSYQNVKNALKRNIVLSVTLSKLGKVITAPYAHTSAARFDEQRSQRYMEAFKTGTKNTFKTGFYAEVHGEDSGHPMDHNAEVYGNSFNVALERGNLENPYEHKNTDVAHMFEEFAGGFFNLANYAVQEQGFYNSN